jgi:hypothetical protein
MNTDAVAARNLFINRATLASKDESWPPATGDGGWKGNCHGFTIHWIFLLEARFLRNRGKRGSDRRARSVFNGRGRRRRLRQGDQVLEHAVGWH